MSHSDDVRFSKKVKRFRSRAVGRGEKAQAAYARAAEQLLFEKRERFERGALRIADVLPGARQVMIERLESCEKAIDQQIPLAMAEEQRLRDAAESWREKYDLEPLEVDEAPDRQGLFAWVAGIASLELLWTWGIMAPGLENWMLDGALVLAPPALTLVLAYLTSIAIDSARHGSWGRRLWSGLSAVPGVGSGFGVHLLSGHYRDDPAGNFVEAALSGPLAFESAASMWLFFFGAVAFVFVLYKLVQARDPIYLYADRLRAWDAARSEVPILIVQLQDMLQAAMHGTIDETDEAVRRARDDIHEAIDIVGTALQRLGVLNPAGWAPSADIEPDPGAPVPAVVMPLVAKWRHLHKLKSSLASIGDVRVRLGTREGEEPGEPPREIERLPEAVRLGEALDWLRRYLDGLGLAGTDDSRALRVMGHA